MCGSAGGNGYVYLRKPLRGILREAGLTAEERKLIEQYPKEAIKVFLQKNKAELATKKVFGRDDQGDESDAFRHFVWAGYLVKELGPDLAKKFLDAHEATENTDDPDRAMDLANNRAGLLVAERLSREKKLTDVEIGKEAINALKGKTLSILNPKGGPK